MQRRMWRILTLLIVALCAWRGRQCEATEQPNIIFIMADDLGYGHLGCYGQQHIRTPHVDRLAQEGLRFTDVYAGCAVCAPCRSVLMTGKHMGHTSIRANSGGVPLLPEDVTVGEVLKAVGYAAGCFGKWGSGDALTEGAAVNQGFDEFFGYYHQIHAHFYYPEYLWHNDRKVPLPGNADGARGQYTHDEILTRGLDFIRAHRDEPFLCYMPFTIPHLELLVPEDSMRPYVGKFPEEPYGKRAGHYAYQPTPFAAYAGMISRLDDGVGQVMSLLKELGLDDNTIVFFTSDNGTQGSMGPIVEYFDGNGPFRDVKGSMYEGGIRVPMVVRWPGHVEPGTVSHFPWYFADVLPTFAELAGAGEHVPADIDGISVVPTLIGEAAAGHAQAERDYLYWELGAGRAMAQAARRGNWKAVRTAADQPIEIYDLDRDLGETTDLAAARPEIAAQMAEILKSAHTPMRPQGEPEMPAGQKYR